MNYSQKLLTELKATCGLPSDYKTALVLGIAKQGISNIKTGKNHFCDETIVKIAQLMKKDPIELLAEKHINNDSGIMRQVWLDILDCRNTAKALEFSGISNEKVA